MKKHIKRGLCSFLAFVLMFTSVQWAEIGTAVRRIYGAQETQGNQKEVIDAESTKSSTTFQLAGGKKQTVFYGQDVRFEDEDGNLKDYDPTLVKVDGGKSESGKDLKEYQYTNKEGDKKHYLPKDLTQDTPILMENGNYVISFAPIYGEKKEDQPEEAQPQAGAAVKKPRYKARIHKRQKKQLPIRPLPQSKKRWQERMHLLISKS